MPLEHAPESGTIVRTGHGPPAPGDFARVRGARRGRPHSQMLGAWRREVLGQAMPLEVKVVLTVVLAVPLVGVWFVRHTGSREDSTSRPRGPMTTGLRLGYTVVCASALVYIWLK